MSTVYLTKPWKYSLSKGTLLDIMASEQSTSADIVKQTDQGMDDQPLLNNVTSDTANHMVENCCEEKHDEPPTPDKIDVEPKIDKGEKKGNDNDSSKPSEKKADSGAKDTTDASIPAASEIKCSEAMKMDTDEKDNFGIRCLTVAIECCDCTII